MIKNVLNLNNNGKKTIISYKIKENVKNMETMINFNTLWLITNKNNQLIKSIINKLCKK
jgi:hypothetical protein